MEDFNFQFYWDVNVLLEAHLKFLNKLDGTVTENYIEKVLNLKKKNKSNETIPLFYVFYIFHVGAFY